MGCKLATVSFSTMGSLCALLVWDNLDIVNSYPKSLCLYSVYTVHKTGTVKSEQNYAVLVYLCPVEYDNKIGEDLFQQSHPLGEVE